MSMTQYIADHCEITPTWDMSEDEWRELRYDGLGGSEIATLMDLNKYQSPYSLWAVKSRLEEPFTGNEATDWGHDLERPVLNRLAKKKGIAIVSWPVFLRSKRKSFMTANLDGVVVAPSKHFPVGEVTDWQREEPPPGVLGVAEAKTGGIATPGKPKEWFEGGDSIPLGYFVQGVWYMHLACPTFTQYGALIGGHGLQDRLLEYNPVTGQHLEDAAEIFWQRILDNDPPPVEGSNPTVDNSDSTEATLKALYPRHTKDKVYEGGAPLAALWEQLEVAKAEAADADRHRKDVRAKIVELLGDAEYAAVDGEYICSFKASKDTERLDSDRLKKERPDLFEQFKKVSAGPRVLRGIT